MSALRNVHSFSNYAYAPSACYSSALSPQTLNFKFALPGNHPQERAAAFNPSRLKFKFSIPLHLQPTTGDAFGNGASSASRFANRVHVQGGGLPDQAPLGTLVLSGNDLINNIAGNVRSLFAGANKVFDTKNPAALAALGFTSGFSVFSGPLNVINGIKEVRTAEKISDVAGRSLGYLKIARGVAFATGGAVLIPVRVLTIASLWTASQIVATMAGTLGSAGSALFSIGSFLAGIGFGIRLNEQRRFRAEFNAILKDPALSDEMRIVKALEHLKQLATISPEEKTQLLSELEADPQYSALSPEQQVEKSAEKEKLLLERKEAFLKRVTSGDCLKLIRQNGPSEAKAVIEAVQKQTLEKVIIASISMALVCIGLATTAASFVFTGPTAIVTLIAVGLATSFSWMLVLGYGLFQEFMQSEPGRYDKLWIFLSSVAATVSVAIIFFFSGGTAAIIASLGAGIIWLGINGVCYYRLYQLEKMKQAALQAAQ